MYLLRSRLNCLDSSTSNPGMVATNCRKVPNWEAHVIQLKFNSSKYKLRLSIRAHLFPNIFPRFGFCRASAPAPCSWVFPSTLRSTLPNHNPPINNMASPISHPSPTHLDSTNSFQVTINRTKKHCASEPFSEEMQKLIAKDLKTARNKKHKHRGYTGVTKIKIKPFESVRRVHDPK